MKEFYEYWEGVSEKRKNQITAELDKQGKKYDVLRRKEQLPRTMGESSVRYRIVFDIYPEGRPY